jgi:hypothetical protein
VYYDGKAYVAITDGIVNQNPATKSSSWSTVNSEDFTSNVTPTGFTDMGGNAYSASGGALHTTSATVGDTYAQWSGSAASADTDRFVAKFTTDGSWTYLVAAIMMTAWNAYLGVAVHSTRDATNRRKLRLLIDNAAIAEFSTPGGAEFPDNSTFWLRITRSGNNITGEYFTTDPALGGVAVYTVGPFTLTGSNATNYGAGVVNKKPGVEIKNGSHLAKIDELKLERAGNTDAWDVIAETGPRGLSTWREAHSFAITSPIVKVYPGFFVSLATGQFAKIKKIRAQTDAGTATISVRKNGSAMSGLTGIAVSSTAGSTSPTENVVHLLSEDDLIDLDVTATSGATRLTITIFVEMVL